MGKRGKDGMIKGVKQGYFPVSTSKKYKGDPKCIYRSSWEYVFCCYCESNPKIVEWNSEPFEIPYEGPTGKPHVYNPDFSLVMDDGSRWLIEIKPHMDTIFQPTPRYKQNAYKWRAAKAWAVAHGWKFAIITEKSSALKGKIKT